MHDSSSLVVALAQIAPVWLDRGSLGMEAPDGSVAPYTVELVAPDGSTTTFAEYGG